MWRPRIILANSLSLRGLMGTLRRIARAVRELSEPSGRTLVEAVPSMLSLEERGDGVCWSGLITEVSS